MHLHPNAKLAPSQRKLLVQRVRKQRWSVTEAAGAAGVSRPTVYKWLRRYEQEGEAGLADRSSRPHRIPIRTPRKTLRRMEYLRRRRKPAWEISEELGVPVSTVSRHLQQLGLGRIWRLEEELDPPRRYEHPRPGDLFHIDAKRFVRIEGVGHRIHGDRSRMKRGAGWEVVFVCIDDHTRLAYAEVLPSENAVYSTAFFRRALKWFESLGIRCRRVLSDNAPCYGSNRFTALCESQNVRQGFTKPYTPRTNGKPERIIQTNNRRWDYRYD